MFSLLQSGGQLAPARLAQPQAQKAGEQGQQAQEQQGQSRVKVGLKLSDYLAVIDIVIAQFGQEWSGQGDHPGCH